MDVISKIVESAIELHDICADGRSYSIYINYDGIEVHVLEVELFFEHFKTFDTKELTLSSQDLELYERPYKVLTDIEGVVFFTLITVEEYKKYVEKTS